MYADIFEKIQFVNIFVAALLFIAGIYFAPSIVDRNIRWMLVYPRWVAKLMEKYFSARWGFLAVFLLILVLNNFSLFTGFLSGFLILLPFLAAFFTGFHVAVIGYDLMGWQGIWHLLINPVAWLEFPASWLSFGMGIRVATVIMTTSSLKNGLEVFKQLTPLYFKYVFTLLVIAALLETAMILWVEKHKDDIK